jgi:hypothetical protein
MFWRNYTTTSFVLGFDMGDWSMLLSGVVLAGLLVVLLV